MLALGWLHTAASGGVTCQRFLESGIPRIPSGGALPEEGNPTKVSIKEIIPLDKVRVPLPSLISIKVVMGRNGVDHATELQELFKRKPGETQVRLRLEARGDFSVILDVPSRVRPDKEFKGEIVRICGKDTLEAIGF